MYRTFKWVTGFMAGAIALAFIAWVCGYVMFAIHVRSLKEPVAIEHTDAMIVLTGGANRVTRALDLLAQGKSQYLFISGVNKGVKLKELLNLWGYKKSLPNCCIILGYEAETTLGNAIEVRKWVLQNRIKDLRLITGTYHMPRALLEFRHALPDTTIIAHPVLPENFTPDQKNFWVLCFLEYHKYLIGLIRVNFYPDDIHPLPAALQ